MDNTDVFSGRHGIKCCLMDIAVIVVLIRVASTHIFFFLNDIKKYDVFRFASTYPVTLDTCVKSGGGKEVCTCTCG